MSKENDRISSVVACLPPTLPATLISSRGSHCEVWQSMGRFLQNPDSGFDLVLKCHRRPCAWAEVRAFNREYQRLRASLEDSVPQALFVYTRLDGQPNLLVLAETVAVWFNIANPAHADEALPLLRRQPRARLQLRRFVEAAQRWYSQENKVIDLYGYDNLVLDKNYQIKYLDSFGVFFHADLLYILDQPDPELQHKIDISLRNLDYLRDLLRQAEPPEDAPHAV